MFFPGKAHGVQWGRYLSGFGDFFEGFVCGMMQILLIRALFGVLFCIGRGGGFILSSIR